MVYLPIVTAVVVFVAGTQLPTSTVSQSISDVSTIQCQPQAANSGQDFLAKDGCPDGYWKVPGGAVNFCYKLYDDQCRSWASAQSRCKSDGGGATLAEPENPLALRKFIVETFGNKLSWLGATGVGSGNMEWAEREREANGNHIITTGSDYWYPEQPGFDTKGKCLLLLAHSSYMNNFPNEPYYALSCQSYSYSLCQRSVVQTSPSAPASVVNPFYLGPTHLPPTFTASVGPLSYADLPISYQSEGFNVPPHLQQVLANKWRPAITRVQRPSYAAASPSYGFNFDHAQ